MKTHFAIIGPRRSGTTFCFRIIRDYSDDFATHLKDEYFNTFLPWYGVKDGIKISRDYERKYLPYEQEIKYRIDLLKKHKCKYTIKIVADHLDNLIIDFLKENYKIIIIERENKFEQYLSFLISEHTNTWGSLKPFKENLQPMHIPLDLAEMYFAYEKEWFSNKKKLIKHSNIITYENLVNDYNLCLQKIGITTRRHSIFYKPIFKMRTLEQKKQLITNLKSITVYFEENQNIWK